MPWPQQAYIMTDMFTQVNLPVQFSYKPLVPPKRVSIEQTAEDFIIQESRIITPGDALVSWECEGSCKKDFDLFFSLYMPDVAPLSSASPSFTYEFHGYWGDVWTFKFHVLDPPTVRSRIWDISGSWRVLDVTSYTDDNIEM